MYRGALERMRTSIVKSPQLEKAQTKAKGLVAQPQQLEDTGYNPMAFMEQGMRRIKEASRPAAEEFEIKKTAPASSLNFADGMPPSMEETTTPEGVKVTTGAVAHGLIPRPQTRDGGGFLGLIDKYEGGADYNALLGFSNRSEFKDTRVTEMTLAEIDRFAKSEYAAWSKEWKRKKGHGDASVPSTPMGRYQFVNTTLQAQARKLGLDPSTTKFDERTQDLLFQSYLKDRLSRADDPKGKVQQLRAAWEGFKKVPEARLLAAIQEFERTA